MRGIEQNHGEDRSRILLKEAVVLHRRAYRETSLLLDVFTADFGRIRLLAKGVKRKQKSYGHLLQPFIVLRLSWAGKGDLAVLTATEPVGGGCTTLEGAALFCGFYMNELLLHLLPPRDPHPEVFRFYLEALTQIGAGDCKESVLRFFELVLLEKIGYGLSLDKEATCGREIDPAKTYAYILDQGPVEAQEQDIDSVHGSTLLGLKRRRLEGMHELREAKRLMRRVIHHHLNGRPLKSRDLFTQPGEIRTP